jgi:hypothetical protein
MSEDGGSGFLRNVGDDILSYRTGTLRGGVVDSYSIGADF